MIAEPRNSAAGSGSDGGYFPGGQYLYSRSWRSPAVADEFVRLVFEGVYGLTRIRLNGRHVGGSISGYREFSVVLDDVIPDAENLIEVEVDNTAQPSSRWYTGSGIYRQVWLERGPRIRIADDGIRIHTRTVEGPAIVDVRVDLDNPDADELVVVVTIADLDGTVVAEATAVGTASAELELAVPSPRLWSHHTPHRYAARVTLRSGEEVIEERELSIGLRTVEVDPRYGLRVNGERVLLQGACVHHDSGILGAATFRAAEFRRARILKENGFNAIRSSHQPISRDLREACDELGLYVMDELTDIWFGAKTAHDLAPRFEEIWRDDARAMVASDRNSPSVIMYSIGNEIAESATARGVQVAHELSEFVRDLDPHRPVTIAVNFLLNLMATKGKSLFDTSDHASREEKTGGVTSTMANVLANKIGGIMQTVSRLPAADKASREVFTAVDIAGYNYAWGRYAADAKRHPDRVVVGSESMPGDIPKIWSIVERTPNVIGDFMWTGWDYLGEAGLGTWTYGSAPAQLAKAYPQLLAGSGVIDITGVPGAQTLLARAAWGALDAPQIAVRPLDRAGERVRRMAWRSTDAIQSWAWNGCEGRDAQIEIYSDDDQVELFLNGRSLGRKRAGKRRGFVARFRTRYEPGAIEVVGYKRGVESGRSLLRSAGTAELRVSSESTTLVADGQDLAFLRIELADELGVVESMAADSVSIEVSGPGTLAALGSAAPANAESFTGGRHATWYGSAQAIIRSTGEPGRIRVTVSSVRHGTRTIELTAESVAALSRVEV
ncbi:glycoside hydrolase family 2 TIM barrel-domain containing protein [Microbacterium saperdae]